MNEDLKVCSERKNAILNDNIFMLRLPLNNLLFAVC